MFNTNLIRRHVISKIEQKIENAQKDYDNYVAQSNLDMEAEIAIIREEYKLRKKEKFDSLVNEILGIVKCVE